MAMTLQEAYDHACWAIPDIRSRLLDDQKRAEQRERGRVEKDAAERARRAGVSVASAPTSGRAAKRNEGKSVRDDIEAALEAVASR